MQPPPGDSPNSQARANAEQVAAWLRLQTLMTIYLLLLLTALSGALAVLVWHSALEWLQLEKSWHVLITFLIGRAFLAFPLMYLIRVVYLKLSRTESVHAAALLGDRVMLSSAIAAQGNYRRNLVLNSSQMTEEIVDGKSRRGVFDRLLSRFRKPQP